MQDNIRKQKDVNNISNYALYVKKNNNTFIKCKEINSKYIIKMFHHLFNLYKELRFQKRRSDVVQ
jgi:L-rhamnose mutarotase